MRADLHLHSYYSDGKYSPAELAKRAHAYGLTMVALTDHDSMGGCDEMKREAKKYGLSFLRGLEISAYEDDCKVHVLGYGCRENDAYSSFLQARAEGAMKRARTMLARGNEFYSLSLTMEDVDKFRTVKTSPVHTMHVIDAFAKALSRDRTELYVEAFVRGKYAYAREGRPSAFEAIDVIHRMGGKAVLAHPGRVLLFTAEEEKAYYEGKDREELQKRSNKRRDELLLKMVEAGLDGIECIYTTHTAEETEFFLAQAKQYGLLVTGGSDFHAEGGRARLGEPPFFVGDELLLLSEE